MKPLVSVIIPAYNSADFIADTIESVLTQSFTDFELIVVDDGGTDGQKRVIENFLLQDQRIKYLFQENKGVSAARNTGFKHSSGKYIAFLDADDVWLPDNLAVKLEKLQDNDFGLVHSDAIFINEKSGIIPGGLSGREGHLLNDLLSWNGTQVPGPSSILMKREVLDATGLFDESLSTSADQDFFIRVAARYRIGRVAEVTWKYRIHNANMHKNITAMEHDVLIVFNKAKSNGLFHNKRFERKCFAITYLVLAASWAGDGRNKIRAFLFLLRAFYKDPLLIRSMWSKVLKKWK